MGEYIKKFDIVELEGNDYLIETIPFITTITNNGALQNLSCSIENRKLGVIGSEVKVLMNPPLNEIWYTTIKENDSDKQRPLYTIELPGDTDDAPSIIKDCTFTELSDFFQQFGVAKYVGPTINDEYYDEDLNIWRIVFNENITEIGVIDFDSSPGLSNVLFASASNDNYHFICNAETVSLPNSVTNIGFATFNACNNLHYISIPNSVISIGDSAFYKCSSLTSVTISNSVTSIGRSAFSNCTGLTSVTIPNNVTSIENYAFNNCTGLASVIIGKNVRNIGPKAFSECTNLTDIRFKGRIEEWILISRDSSWHDNVPAQQVFCEEDADFAGLDNV